VFDLTPTSNAEIMRGSSGNTGNEQRVCIQEQQGNRKRNRAQKLGHNSSGKVEAGGAGFM
jgi:hypothetical protein